MPTKNDHGPQEVPVTLDADRFLWERQTDEPILWFERFLMFIFMGVKRSVVGIYRRHRLTKCPDRVLKVSTAPARWLRLAKKWRWRERAEAYDATMYLEILEDAERERRLALSRHRAQAQEWATAGIAWLEAAKQIKDGRLALKAWHMGVEVERKSLVPASLLRIMAMSDEELLEQYASIIKALKEDSD